MSVKITLEFDDTKSAIAALMNLDGSGGVTPTNYAPNEDPDRPGQGSAGVEQPEKPPRKRRTKAEIEADKAAQAAADHKPDPEPAPQSQVDDDPFGETPAPAAKLTIEDVREAMKTYQATVKAKLIAGGKAEEDARKESLEVARGLLGKVSGSQIFGDLKEEQYAAVVEAAKAATAKV